MSKAEKLALKLIIPKQVDDIEELCRFFYIKGYKQAEKDLLENKHEKSWRLDEKLWKGIKDIEEASYQYMYDASNDWAYDIPTWNDVQDAFKAGSEWKEGLELTWEDIRKICGLSVLVEIDLGRTISDERHYTEVLKRLKDFKERKKI
jgi:hypothetical protein